MAEAIETRDWSDWYAWATPEATALKHVRKRLRDAFGFPKSVVHAQAYWTAGREMGTCREGVPDAAADGASTCLDDQPEVALAQAETPEPVAQSPVAATPRGSWRAQAAGRLLAPLRFALILSGVLQVVATLVQLARSCCWLSWPEYCCRGPRIPALARWAGRRFAAGPWHVAWCRPHAVAARG
ncbi:siderophore-interacting family protein [Mycobacterium ulcerans str. Harvey]|uniref:Siderophore-interacting family protein n=1 Tax=Mycobacterium ulcerans str. Harvey TaxID=1299332 RepID=A0ABN0QRB1_MYCUL|nr:siderophore-interacting family protein [Mycobacterium ulcerans str. Harvey]